MLKEVGRRAVAAVGAAFVLAASPAMAQASARNDIPSQTEQNQASGNERPSTNLYTLPTYAAPSISGENNTAARRLNDISLQLLEKQLQGDGSSKELQRTSEPGEFETFVSDLAGRPVRRFGSELLIPGSRDFIAPPTTVIPPDYRINPGDQIEIGLAGSIQAADVVFTVNPDGRIFVPQVGPIEVAGVTYRGLRDVVAAAISRQFRNFTLSVSIAQLHGITVYVTGFAATPGSYTVSSLSTLVNAVLAAGGPSAGGSFRSIQVRRDGRVVSNFDLYDFLLKGDKSGDIVLQNGDVIFIAPSGPQVAVIGSVNKEAVYEAKSDDTLKDVLLYAGGTNTVADISRLYLLNPLGQDGWQEITQASAAADPARRGLVLRVLSGVGIAQPINRLQALVAVSGEVAKPGRYFVKPGTTLNEVVAMAGGLTADAYPFAAVFVRDSVRRRQTINYAKAIGELQMSLTAQPLVTAGSQQQDFNARIAAVQSLVDQLKQRSIDGRLVLQSSGNSNAISGDFVVENNDALYIPPRNLAVGVYGMVNSSADFRFASGKRVKDYIALAGGVTRIADKRHLFVVRANGTLLSGREARDAPALPGDLIFVPVDANRGEFWAKLRDLTSTLFNGVAVAASVKVLAQ